MSARPNLHADHYSGEDGVLRPAENAPHRNVSLVMPIRLSSTIFTLFLDGLSVNSPTISPVRRLGMSSAWGWNVQQFD